MKNFGSTLDKLQPKLFQLFPIQKSVLYNILKVLRNPMGGKYHFSVPETARIGLVAICPRSNHKMPGLIPDTTTDHITPCCACAHGVSLQLAIIMLQ